MANRIVRLTESDLTRLVKRIINEQDNGVTSLCNKDGFKWAKSLIRNTNDFTITVDPSSPEYILVKDRKRGIGCACKRDEIFP